MKIIANASPILIPGGWRAKIVNQYECEGTTYYEVEMTPERWNWRYWLGRLRMALATWHEGTVSE